MQRSVFRGWMFAVLVGLTVAGCGGGEPVPHRVATLEPEADKTGSDIGTPFADLSDRLLMHERSAEQTTIDALANIGEPAVPALVAVLKDPDPLMRQNAARTLARMGPAAEPATSELIAAIGDKNLDVRKFATRALGEIGPPASKAVPALIQELRFPRQTHRAKGQSGGEPKAGVKRSAAEQQVIPAFFDPAIRRGRLGGCGRGYGRCRGEGRRTKAERILTACRELNRTATHISQESHPRAIST